MGDKANDRLLAFFILFILLLIGSACSKKDHFDVEEPDVFLTDSNYISLDASLARAVEISGENFEKRLSMSSNKFASREIQSYTRIKSDDGMDVMRIVNFNGGGFMILSADRRASPVVAYSETSSFPTDTVPAAVDAWLYDVKLEIEDLRKRNVPYLGQDKHLPFGREQKADVLPSGRQLKMALPIDDDPPVCEDYIYIKGPFLQTEWHQMAPYNIYMPELLCIDKPALGGRAYTGCTATAMAQIIRYHQYPNTFDYWMMPNTVLGHWDINPGSIEVARLMATIDSTLVTTYNCNVTESAANLNDIVNSFKNHFGYASTVRKEDFDFYTVKTELQQYRPVILTGYTIRTGSMLFGYDYYDGHAWVTDGYKEVFFCDPTGEVWGWTYLYFHMNWGWEEGTHNGWFGFGSANPGDKNYQYNRKMIVGIRKP